MKNVWAHYRRRSRCDSLGVPCRVCSFLPERDAGLAIGGFTDCPVSRRALIAARMRSPGSPSLAPSSYGSGANVGDGGECLKLRHAS